VSDPLKIMNSGGHEKSLLGMNVDVCRSHEELKRVMSSEEYGRRYRLERFIADSSAHTNEFHLFGFCMVCEAPTAFLIDQTSGATWEGSTWIPNWRERGECSSCRLNNRQRAIFYFLKAHLEDTNQRTKIYLTEQATAVYSAFSERLDTCEITGSEFLGADIAGGTIRDGIRHEDIERLSFKTSSFDFVVSNDVLEHVNDPLAALREMKRVLRPGGLALLTFPFDANREKSERRADLQEGGVEFILPPVYHGNPISSSGSLVFTDFGWDILDVFRDAGFEDVRVLLYWSYEYCHLGIGQLYFQAQ
jgi:SAM-dependent methyltransferase